MRLYFKRIAQPRAWVLLALVVGVAVAVTFGGTSLASSSRKAHSNRYQLSFERTGTGACCWGWYWVLEGTATHVSSKTPVTVTGSDKSEGDSLGVALHNSYGQVDLSGTIKLSKDYSNNYLGQEGSGSVNAWVQMDTSGEATWVVKFTVACF